MLDNNRQNILNSLSFKKSKDNGLILICILLYTEQEKTIRTEIG